MLSIKGQTITKISDKNNILTKESHITSKTLDKPPLPKKKKKNIKILKQDYVCDERRQNNLNARFIRKKQQLFDITRQNVRIFQKINTQKSVYSFQSLHKSYESNKSLNNSRMSHISNKSIKKSQISNSSKASQKSNIKNKNTFFNRAISAKSIGKQIPNKIIIRDIKRRSMVNLKPQRIQQTKAEDIQQFERLFNIRQQPTGKQRNRPIRIRSTKVLRPLQNIETIKNYEQKGVSQSKQIVINEQNQIQIHQQIQAEQQQGGDTFRDKSSRGRSYNGSSNVNNQHNSNLVLQDNKKLNILPSRTQQSLKNSNRSQKQSQNSLCRKYNRQNIQNLFELKNSYVKTRLGNKYVDEKVAAKYTNLLSKINSQLNKNVKKTKQSTIYPYKSRLIA